jgi:hypothetical protein
MQFSDTTNNLGIIQACERYTNLGDTTISGNTDKLKEFTAYINTSMRRIWHKIFMSSGEWIYDDGNQTNLPQATTALVDGQATYALPTGALTIQRVEFKDESGIWTEIRPITLDDIHTAVEEYKKEDGKPDTYRLLDDTIELFPAPDFGQVASLKIYFERGSVAFSYTDTTQSPGFVAEYHDLVPLEASLEWLKIHLPGDGTTAQLKEDYTKTEANLMAYYNRRFKAHKIVMTRHYNTFK